MARQEIGAGSTTIFLDNINNNFKELYNLPTIFCGTNEPDTSLGKIGDIYVQYEEEIEG